MVVVVFSALCVSCAICVRLLAAVSANLVRRAMIG